MAVHAAGDAEDVEDGEVDDEDLLEGDFFAMGGSCFCCAFRLLDLAMASTLTVLLSRLLKRPRTPAPLPLLVPSAAAEAAPIGPPDGEGIVNRSLQLNLTDLCRKNGHCFALLQRVSQSSRVE